jgi:hypothetical protein
MLFHDKDRNEMWSNALFQVYGQLEREKLYSLPASQRKDYLNKELLPYYLEQEQEIAEKIVKYNNHWKQHKRQITEAFSEAFQRDYTDRLNNMIGNITLNPIEPRFLNAHSFDVFHLNSERGALGVALHEITHFAWFDIWQAHFMDDCADYETPHIKWIFSEMAVDSIMRKDKRLHGVNPYFPDAHVYEYFNSMKLEGKPVLETLYEMYKRVGIVDFMEWGLAYCIKHEDEIRAQIKHFLQ